MLVGAHIENGKTTRTRPICAYPTVAKYKGSGSIDAAENFTCVLSGI
jgi:feruloyl esterase